MASPDDTKKYIEGLKKKIRREAKTSPCLSEDLPENNIYNYLNKAEQYAKIGADVPSFSRLSATKRVVYRWITKFLFKVLKVIKT